MTTDPAGTTPASANFEKLKAKLRELFELDKADLDFGIYRVLRARHAEITEFLDRHLEKTVREALQAHSSLQQTQLQDDLRKAEQAARDAGVDADQAPRVLEIRERVRAGGDLDALADEVYSHLYTFFSRYYQEGDFLGLHRATIKGREKYMLPYNGEEVNLVWANQDQYYIKSSELLRDYAFQVTPGAGTLLEGTAADRVTVHFKLVEADTEKDNRKPNGKVTRAFALDDEAPFFADDPTTLSIRFRYREHPSERNLQDKLNADTERTLADHLPPAWKAVLFAPDPTHQAKSGKDTRTILQKHLRAYTARHQFDYFIHKDLGGFMGRELDFYLKNEVMHLDDIEAATAPKAEEYLSKLRAIRRCAQPVIRMLAQLENFQKKLWLKKKFVVETRYCITLDRVPGALYPEIAASDAQRQEWVQLYAIHEIAADGDQPGYSEPLTVEFLHANPYMMVDTRHFGREFTLRLLTSIDDLDESLNGVCFHSENFQALQLARKAYESRVGVVFSDPPYNTGADDFLYKDTYQHSSWLSFMADRISSLRPLLDKNGALFLTIDFVEVSRLRMLCDLLLGEEQFLADIAWEKRYTRSNNAKKFYSLKDTVLAFRATRSMDSIKEGRTEKSKTNYANPDKDPRGPWISSSYVNPAKKEARTNLVYPIANPFTGKSVDHPTHAWKYDKNTHETHVKENRLYWGEDGSYEYPRLKSFLSEASDGMVPVDFWRYQETGTTDDGGKTVKELFGDSVFSNPKPVTLVTKILGLSGGSSCEDVVCDIFAGSGTTAHAVIKLNREDARNRKYVLAEVGEHFEHVLVPRLKKVVHSMDWKDGKPQHRNTGVSHALKIVRLEGYEDALNNLRLTRTPGQQIALAAAPERTRDDYLLGYFLDVESAGSASLLDLDQFRDPFAYKLNIAASTVGETRETPIDLVETFNWLLGLKVKHMDAQRGFLTVTGEKRAGGRTLVIWRTLSDDAVSDNRALEAFLDKIAVNPADTEFDYIYLNGSHTLADPHNKVHLTEEAFQRLMFDAPDFGMEA